MRKRENEILETLKSLSERNKELLIKEAEKRQAKLESANSFRDNYYIRQAMRDRKNMSRSQIMEGARNDALSTIVKAIYISALEAESLTDEGLLLAESMVDTWIKENGGATKILSKVGNNTYLLSRITQIVEDVALKEVEEIEADDDQIEEDEKKAEEQDTKDAALDAAKEFIKNASKEELKQFVDDVKSVASDRKEEIKDEKEEEKAGEADKKLDDELEKAERDAAEEEIPEVDDLDKDEDGDVVDDIESEDKEDKKEEKKAEDEAPEEPKDSEKAEEDKKDENKSDEEDKSDDSDPLVDDSDDDLDFSDIDLGDGDDSDIDSIATGDDDQVKDIELDDPDIDNSVVDDIEEPDEDEDITIDGDTDSDDTSDSEEGESHGKVFDELEKEEDVKKAIDLIRSRIADAEEKFIKNNAEDKKKIDDLLNKISQNVKTVEDMNERGDKKNAEIASESVRMDKRRIDAIRDNRPLTVFECMTRKYSANILKDSVVKEAYLNESGSIDTELVVESSKIMYGFLETINTLKLEKVDAKYIKNVLDNM